MAPGLLLAMAALPGGLLHAQSGACAAGVSLPAELATSPGQVVSVPLTLTDVTGLGVISGDVTVLYDPSVLDAVSVAGSPLLAGCTLTPNLTIAGEIRLSVYCTSELEGGGPLASLSFHVAGTPGAWSPLTISTALLNEGVPSVCPGSGSLLVCGGADDDCDGLDQDCDGVADDAYPSQGFACAPPRCGVTGSRTCMGGVEVQSCAPGGQLDLPDSVLASPGSPVQVPLHLSDVGGQGVLSADLTVTYDPAVALATDVTAGDLTSNPGCVLTSNLATPGSLVLSVFCTQPLAGGGTLALLEFQALAPGGVSALAIASAVLNEGNPAVCSENGSLDVCGGDATLWIPEALAAPAGAILTVPVEVSDLTGLGVLSADVVMGFDPEVLEAISASPGGVSSGCTLTANLTAPGSARLSIFCTTPRSGSGTLALVRFRSIGAWCAGTPLSLAQGILNEGSPAVCRDAGSFRTQGADLCDGQDNDCNGIGDDGFDVGAACIRTSGSCPLPAHVACAPDGTASECRNDPTLDVLLVADGPDAAVEWLAIPGAGGYDVIRGGLLPLRAGMGDFALAAQSCLADDASFRSLVDGDTPPAGDGWWYLMRAAGCTGADTYETGSASQAGMRDPEIALAAGRCP